MASTVDICNRALQKLGAKRITSITEDSVNARACNVAFEPVKLKLLRSHTWNFSKKRVQLAADATEPVFGYDYAYSLPADYVKLLPPDPESNVNDLDWQIEGKKILTNDAAPIDVRYIYNVSDANEMDALFRELLATELAFELCEELTQSNTKKEGLREDKRDILSEARRNNAIEQPVSHEPPEGTWLTARG